jgi:hypothetical protein
MGASLQRRAKCGKYGGTCVDVRPNCAHFPKVETALTYPRSSGVGWMQRRAFIAGLGGAAAWPVVARAQPSKVWRVGYLSSSFTPLRSRGDAVIFEAFRQQMNDLGYVEGKNLIIEAR